VADVPQTTDRPVVVPPPQQPIDAAAAARNEKNRAAEALKAPHPDWSKTDAPKGPGQVKGEPLKAPDLSTKAMPGAEHVPGIQAGLTPPPEASARPERPITLTGNQPGDLNERNRAVEAVKQPHPDWQKPEPVRDIEGSAAERAKASAGRILELSKGNNPAVRLTDAVKGQLTRIAEGPAPGKPLEVPSKKGPVEIGEQQARALGVLETLAEATAARREQSGDKNDQLSIMSYVRGGEGKHGTATGFDIAAYGGHKFDQTNPDESRAAVQTLLKDLPPGDYGLGLPRLPTKEPIPENAAHYKQYLKDVADHPAYYDKGLLSRYDGTPPAAFPDPLKPAPEAKPRATDELRNAPDPHFEQPKNAGEVKPFGDPSRLDPVTRGAIADAKGRDVHVTPFPDGLWHAHLSVVPPGAKTF
jgi:hypothetical protein